MGDHPVRPDTTRPATVTQDELRGRGGRDLRDPAGQLRIADLHGEPRKAALTWKPQNTVAIDDEQGEKLLRLIETLNEHDDVQNVYANFEVSDSLVQKMSA